MTIHADDKEVRALLDNAIDETYHIPHDVPEGTVIEPTPKKPKAKRVRPPSRGDRWSAACDEALAGLQALVDLQAEFSDWHDNMPENLQQSATGSLLEEICNLDLESALSTVQDAEACQIPRGYGKD